MHDFLDHPCRKCSPERYREIREEKVMKWVLIVASAYFIIRIVVSLIWKI